MKYQAVKNKSIAFFLGVMACLILLEVSLRFLGFFCLITQNNIAISSNNDKNSYRILCIGESTTAWGSENSYPNQLEKILNSKDLGVKFDIINKGVPAITTPEIIKNLPGNIKKYHPHMIVAMMGANDWWEIDDDFIHIIDPVNPPENIKYQKPFWEVFKIFKFFKWLTYDPIRDSEQYKLQRAAIKKYPHEDKYYVGLLGYLQPRCQKERCWKEYKELVDKAVIINPDNTLLQLSMLIYYQEHGMLKEAYDLLIRLKEQHDKSQYLTVLLADVFMGFSNYEIAEDMLRQSIEKNPNNDVYLDLLATVLIHKKGDNLSEADSLRAKAEDIRYTVTNSITQQSTKKLQAIAKQHGIRLVVLQYPQRSTKLLKKLLGEEDEKLLIVDNERLFYDLDETGRYDEYYVDRSGAKGGHCTPKGNKMIARHLAEQIILKWFTKK